jgi:hypothetical protein
MSQTIIDRFKSIQIEKHQCYVTWFSGSHAGQLYNTFRKEQAVR